MSLTVAIVDNNTLLRDGIAALLMPIAGLSVVAIAESHVDAIDVFRVALIGVSGAGEPLADARRADVRQANFDIAMRLMRHPTQPRVVLMNQVPVAYPKALIHAGVSGFIAADASLDELVKALRLAAMDQRYVSPSLAQAWLLNSTASDDAHVHFAELSARELQVMQHILADKRVAEIAEALSISPKTVATYRSRLMEKLGVRSDIALLRLAQAAGLCP
ncbi:MAG: response regulator transcription factor [Paraperlucidibaca sp.]